MFFSAELLSKRDNGFGLLWLAATLGSKSVFKKLPKRSVMTADISQLCDLISEPAEPLALRLSSNLMVGVARVYKVKQEILYADVSNCVASLKKVTLEFPGDGSGPAQLQMAQPTVRAAAVTLDPRTIGDMDAFVADWEVFLNFDHDQEGAMDVDDEEYEEGNARQQKKKKRPTIEPHEDARAEAVTLKESYEHLLSNNSFDVSFSSQAPGAADISSSQADVGFVDPFFADGVDLGIGDLGDELAREMGWGVPPTPPIGPGQDMEFGVDPPPMDIDMDYNFGALPDADVPPVASSAPTTPGGTARKRKAPGDDKENADAIPFSRAGAGAPPLTFNQEIMSQDDLAAVNASLSPLADVTGDHNRKTTNPKKSKKTRLLLDARTELTDEELKLARTQYLQGQKALREEMETKRFEKEHGRMIDELIWSVPNFIQNDQLGDFWQAAFRVQVEARTGALHIHDEELARPQKRRKTQKNRDGEEELAHVDEPYNNFGMDFDVGMDMVGMQDDPFMDAPGQYAMDEQRHSSEEPGQARRAHSRQSSLSRAQFGLEVEANLESQPSQRSRNMYPWDNAGVLSSSSGVGFPDHISIDRADVALKPRSSLNSRRDGSPGLSAIGSAGVPVSPGFERGSQAGDDYRFDVDGPEERSIGNISQRSEVNPVTLEKNSFNFLEYAKIQMQTLPDAAEGLSFDTIVPKESNKRVAAAAFYNCLVLATKDLVRLKQPEPYAPLVISLVAV
ncbi:hypothetical protein CYLTODRAFT_487083 [Cylindrobasidium torrendii FP15055 ss-10]|uniref:Rad21/Rec8-like protein N-terminal domain-containing protein n=1 Tax=Cylindrobasidium torrendii FP15055 ss-10 TaxID=1314674 RepID=A0A0D7BPW2_9AGAR|nr:hypothetical protein CYLTODRAFT_487083 [Cylindrobasidium torrendii FP15055 ss-10]